MSGNYYNLHSHTLEITISMTKVFYSFEDIITKNQKMK